jgi:Undecaprenyl-phosphate galactose phosphotransferase WbaP
MRSDNQNHKNAANDEVVSVSTTAERQPSFDFLADQVSDLTRQLGKPKDGGLAYFPTTAEATMRRAGRMLLLADIVAMVAAFVLGGVLAWVTNIHLMKDTFQALLSPITFTQMSIFIGMGTAALLWLDQRGHYRQRSPYWENLGDMLAMVLFGLVVSGFIQFAFKNEFSRLWLGLSWVLFGMLMLTARAVVRRALDKRDAWHIPVLLVGDGPTAEAARSAIMGEREMGYRIVGQVGAQQVMKLAAPRDWQRLLADKGAGYILLALEGGALDDAQDSIAAAVRGRLPYMIVPPWLGLSCSGLSPHSFFTHDVMLLQNTNRLKLPLPRLVKRTFDIAVAGTLLALLSPAFVFIALMVKRDGGPAFYADRRVGQHGRVFNCHKFRSMLMNNEAILQKHLAANPAAAVEWAAYQKLKDDPRITALGRFIRKTSMDELPQLLNVITGDMSLVGPRPIMPGQESFYGGDFTFYTAVRPGITGPWQVSGRNKLTFEQRVRLECWYARNWSLWMDIVILLKTVPTVLGKNSAAH